MPAALAFLVYCAFVAGVALLLLYIWVSGHLRPYVRCILLGLLASPLGFLLSYAAFMGFSALYYRAAPPYNLPDGSPFLWVFLALLLFVGPIVGPPLVFILVATRCQEHPKA